MVSTIPVEQLSVDCTEEIRRYSSFDHATRRSIAYALAVVPADDGPPLGLASPQNAPLPLTVTVDEQCEREAAYAKLAALRRGQTPKSGNVPNTLLLADIIESGRMDVRWKRLSGFGAYFFLYERLVGAEWRELLIVAWREAIRQRRVRSPAVQLPLDARMRSDGAFLRGLSADPGPSFYPSMADADAFGVPLLSYAN